VVLIRPEGYDHGATFSEVIETVTGGLRALGAEVSQHVNKLLPGPQVLLFGSHLLPAEEARRVPAGSIIYNLEQIDGASSWCSPTYLDLLKRCQVWDYSRRNIESLLRLGVKTRPKHVPIGYVPELTRIAPSPDQDIDVLFYGSMNERRARVMGQLEDLGLNAHAVFGVYGPERDALIARAKVVLNLHFYETSIFELVRVSYLLANHKAVVAECRPGTEIDEDMRDAVRTARYEDVAAACAELVANPGARHELGERGFARMAARDEAGILSQALDMTPGPCPEHRSGAKPRRSGGRVTSKPSSKPGPEAGGAVLLSACLIVKDEEKALPDCLASLHQVVDEVVVYDTGSTDKTVEVARRAGAKVIEGYWDDDFGRARNASLERCRGEWILWVDADERFVCPNVRELRAGLARLKGVDAFFVDITNFGGDGSAVAIAHRAFRLFRKATCQWYGALHEQVDLRPGLHREVRASALRGAHIDHYGYIEQVVRERDKTARNLRIAEAAVASATVRPGQEGMPELNLARALAAVGKLDEAQLYYDKAAAASRDGLPLRASLFHGAQNLMGLGRLEEAVATAQRFQEACSRKDLAYYLEGMARRRLGQPEAAVALFDRVGEPTNEDSFTYPLFMLHAERAGALLEAGRAGEAADELVLLVEQNPDIRHITAALKAFAVAGKSIDALVAAMPADRLDRVGAALTLVPPAVADQMAEALWARFGARPQLLAASIRFAPELGAARALEWSARLRSIAMARSCPLLARAARDDVTAAERVRAGVIAHAAFGDQKGAELAVVAGPLVPVAELEAVLAEVALIDPALVPEISAAAGRRAQAPGAQMDAQMENGAAALPEDAGPVPQLAALGADR
jgi:tetratricopeptide (TPR) repeat protein